MSLFKIILKIQNFQKYSQQHQLQRKLILGLASMILFYCCRNRMKIQVLMKNLLTTPKQPQPKLLNNVCKIFLIGLPGVGKTKLFKKISTSQHNNLNFQEFQLSSQYSIVDTPSIQFDDSIEKREETINLFQEIFSIYGHLICKLYIVVNFERTDLMKRKISDVYKYFRKFAYLLGIIVTDFERSENPVQDKLELLKAFQVYQIEESKILFINFNDCSEAIREQIVLKNN